MSTVAKWLLADIAIANRCRAAGLFDLARKYDEACHVWAETLIFGQFP